jgi:hypothetical protein
MAARRGNTPAGSHSIRLTNARAICSRAGRSGVWGYTGNTQPISSNKSKPATAGVNAACQRAGLELHLCSSLRSLSDTGLGVKSRRARYGLWKHIAIADHLAQGNGSAETWLHDRFGLEFAVRDPPDCSHCAHFCV